MKNEFKNNDQKYKEKGFKKKDLLELLEDEDVIRKIKDIVLEDNINKTNQLDSKNEDLLEKIEELKSNKSNLETKNRKLKNNLINKDKEIEVLKEKNHELNTKLEDKVEIINNKRLEIEHLERQIEDKDKNIEEKINRIERLSNDKTDLKIKIEDLEKQKFDLENKLEKQEEEIKRLNNMFAGIEETYQIYSNLPFEIKDSLQGVFTGDSIKEFIYCGVQYDSLKALWDYIKGRVVRGEQDHLDDLNQIFDYFFAAYNKVYKEPLYKRQEVEIGQKIDEDKHIRSKNSKAMGEIKEIFIKGYVNLRTDKLMKKSVVKAER